MAGEGWKALVALGLLIVVFGAVIQVEEWNAEPAPQESMEGIATALFDVYVVPFLVLAVLLTGALFGALYMGMHTSKDDEEAEA
jgi:NADH:ubiquinone oxidoreductase subunit 6 (subunit J)